MSLTTKRSIKLYDHLTSKQKAAIALGIYDPDELQILAGTVERKTYSMRDAAFLDWSDYAFKISTVISMAYWKSQAAEYRLKFAIRGAALVADEERTDAAMVERERVLMADVMAQIPTARGNQKASLVALQTLAEENGFHFDDCLKLADIELDEVVRLEDVEPAQDRLDFLIDNLRSIAPRL